MSQCGIGSIVNKHTGKLFIFKSKDLTKTWENYHALLNANYHHNKELQNDWNELGSSYFVFEIKEVIDDDNLLNEKLDEYLKNTDNIYLNANLESIPFNYKTKILIDELYYIVGETQINPIFSNKLSINDVEESYYPQIKNDALKSIKNGEVKIGEVDLLLDKLIAEIVENKAIELKNKKENQLAELYELTGESELKTDYLDILEKNGLSQEVGLEIKNSLLDLINSNQIESSVKDEFNKLIKENKLIEDKKQEDELISQLQELTGQLDLTQEYVNKLEDKGLTPETGFIIRNDIKKQIQDGKIRNVSIEEVLDNALDEECEKIAIEKENALIDYLYDFIGKDDLSSQFKSKLDVFNLDENKGFEIKKTIYDLIKSREITEDSQIVSKIDELIEIEVIKETKIKEELFNQLHETLGEDQLNSEFKSKLTAYNIDEEWGISLLKSLENDITAHKINEGFDFKSHIDESILDKKESDMTDELNGIFEDEEFINKLNKNFLNEKDSTEMKSKLMKIINSRDIDSIVNLENKNLENEINNLILQRHDEIKDEVLDTRENLLGDLYVVVNEEYAPKVKSNQVREETVERIKNDIEDIIKKDEIIDSKFKYKIDELRNLKNRTVKVVFNSFIDEEKKLENEKLTKLRKEIKQDTSALFSKDSTSFINIKLKQFDLPESYASKTEKKINFIIDSNTVSNKKFDFKVDELEYYKEKSFKDEIVVILNEFRVNLDKKLTQLYEITGKDELNDSFKNLLSNKGLNENAGWKIVNEFKDDIVNERNTTNIQAKINARLNQLEIDKNQSYELLDNKVGADAGKFFFAARLGKRHLNSEIHGMNIKRNMETLIESGEVNANNFDDVLRKELDNEVVRKNDRLKKDVDNIIGLDKVHPSFLSNIAQYNLDGNDALKIRTAILNSIKNNEIEEGSVQSAINNLIQNKGTQRGKELSIKKVNDIIGQGAINAEFTQKLTLHDLDNSDGQKIKNDAIKLINEGKLDYNAIDNYIENSVQSLDEEKVKSELNNLSGDKIDSIMKKHSLSMFLPLKSAKINKLLENLSLNELKTDLAECGVARYKIKYGSGFSKADFGDGSVNNFCSNCGAKLDKGSKFCSSCGTKVD